MGRKDDIVQKLRTVLPEGSVSLDDSYRTGVCASVVAPLSKLRDTAAVFKDAGFYLESQTAIDFEDTAELLYHFNCFEPKSRVVMRVLCGHDQTPATVGDLFATASWQEREIHELFGIKFTDNPDLRPLLMPEDADFYPLKKTYGNVHAYLRREEIYG